MDSPACPRCGSVISTGPEGLCPGCLLLGALAARPPGQLGGYELLEIIGRGGMGVVHRARQVQVGHEVALKRIRAGELATDEEVARFVHEARTASRLAHPNIVRIYHVEEHDGRPFFTMELLDGSLDRSMDRFREPRAAARLVAKLARAVHHGHDRGVLHRDLKPANILLDAEGEPRVADFGVAKVHGEGLQTDSGLVPGTVHYMAPEQAAGRDVTRAADVWSLAAILYELLTCRRPFEGRSAAEVIRRIREEEPSRPRTLAPGLDRDLDTICLKGLQKEPSHRYGSAAQMADDLERFLRGEPIAARPLGPAARAWRWCRRHPIGAASAVAAVILLAGVTGALLSVTAAQEAEMRRDVLEANVYAARAVAGTVLFQIQSLADRVQAAAADPSVVAVAAGADCRGENGGAEMLLAPHGAGSAFDSMSIFDARGSALRRWPAPSLDDFYFCKDFSWRDYFRGAERLARAGRRSVHVARALQSEGDGQRKFTIAAPILPEGGGFAGVVNGTLGTDSALGALRLRDPSDARRTAVLVGPLDNERSCRDCPPPAAQAVLLHDGLPHGSTATLDSPGVREIQVRVAAIGGDPFQLPPEELARADDDYRDPLSGPERWLAGMAPVGLTGYVVIVQTRDDAAVEPNVTLLRRLALVGIGAAAGGIAVVGAIVWLDARTRKRGA